MIISAKKVVFYTAFVSLSVC